MNLRGRELKWRKVEFKNDISGGNVFLGHEATQSLAYAVCFLRSETERPNLHLLNNHLQAALIYLNGKRIYQSDKIFNTRTEIFNPIVVNLHSGINVMVIKAMNETYGWGKPSIWFADASGNVIQDLKVVITPEPSELNEAERMSKSDILKERAKLSARKGRWTESAESLNQLLESNPGEFWNWVCLAPLLAQRGDLAGYSNRVELMLQRFKDTKNPIIAERIARVCLLAPGGEENMKIASQLAERAITLGKGHQREGLFQFTLGLAEYRHGRYAKACDWLQRSLEREGGYRVVSEALIYPVLAMAQFQLKKSDEARTALGEGKEAKIEAGKREWFGNPNPSAADWPELVIADLLLREAKELIEGPAKTQNENNAR